MTANKVIVRKDGSKRVFLDCQEIDKKTGEVINPGLTKQAFKKDCDINYIMQKYEKTGVVEHLSRYNGQYGDFSDVQDYHSSLNQVIAADEMFMTLPAGVRKEFDNDPGKFLDFVGDPKNEDRMVELGLAHRRVPESTPVKDAEKAPSVSDEAKKAEKPNLES